MLDGLNMLQIAVEELGAPREDISTSRAAELRGIVRGYQGDLVCIEISGDLIYIEISGDLVCIEISGTLSTLRYS